MVIGNLVSAVSEARLDGIDDTILPQPNSSFGD